MLRIDRSFDNIAEQDNYHEDHTIFHCDNLAGFSGANSQSTTHPRKPLETQPSIW